MISRGPVYQAPAYKHQDAHSMSNGCLPIHYHHCYITHVPRATPDGISSSHSPRTHHETASSPCAPFITPAAPCRVLAAFTKVTSRLCAMALRWSTCKSYSHSKAQLVLHHHRRQGGGCQHKQMLSLAVQGMKFSDGTPQGDPSWGEKRSRAAPHGEGPLRSYIWANGSPVLGSATATGV